MHKQKNRLNSEESYNNIFSNAVSNGVKHITLQIFVIYLPLETLYLKFKRKQGRYQHFLRNK